MEGENAHYVSFLDDQMRAEAATGAGAPPQGGSHGEIGGQQAGAHHLHSRGHASVFRKLLQSHRYKARLAAAVGFLAVIFFAGSFWYLHSVNNAESDIFPGGWTPDVVRRTAATGDNDATVWDIAGNPLEAWNWTQEQFEGVFTMWVKDFGKSYASAEERAQRFRVFKRNVMYVATHNSQGYSYKLKVNEFADLTRDEFRARYLGYKKTSSHQLLGKNRSATATDDLLAVNDGDLPSSIDWREKGCVREVKDQGQCGSCWAFSATGAMEGAACAQAGEQVNLSEQQLMDCSRAEGTNSCNGGEMEGAFQYVIDNHGLCSEKDYPYEMKDDKCRHKCKPVLHLKKYENVPPKHETALKAAIVKYGPVSVGIEADQLPFQFYHEGVFDASCGNTLDHGVLVVGYGTDAASGKDYWIVKNSWGPRWGDHGYIMLARHMGSAGECGILLDPSFPIVEKEEAPGSSSSSKTSSPISAVAAAAS